MASEGDNAIWAAFWWAVAGGLGLLVGISKYFLKLNTDTRQEVIKKTEEVGIEAIEEGRRIWTEINALTKAHSLSLLEAEKRFITTEDLDRTETRILEGMRGLLREHETNVQNDVTRLLTRHRGGDSN